MASPPIPPQLDHLITRPFSFYPPIIGIEHNEWLYRKASWSEILVVNCKSGAEIWLSRRYIGEVSRVDDPVLIVGLKSELEYKGGMVVPFQRHLDHAPLEGHHHSALVFQFAFQPNDEHRVVHPRHFADVPPGKLDLRSAFAVDYQDLAPTRLPVQPLVVFNPDNRRVERERTGDQMVQLRRNGGRRHEDRRLSTSSLPRH